MFHTRTHGIHGLFLLCQSGLISVFFWLWLPWARIGHEAEKLPLMQYGVYNAVLLFGIAVGYFTERDKNYFRNPALQVSARNSLWQLLFSVGSLFVYLVALQDNSISRLFLFSFVPVLFTISMLSHQYLPALLIQASFSGSHEQRIALIGTAEKAAMLSGWLVSKTDIGCKTIGFVSDEHASDPPKGLQMLGSVQELERIIHDWRITQAVVVGFPKDDGVLHHCTEVCERLGVRLLVFCDFEAKLRQSITMFEENGFRFVGLRKEPLENPLNRLIKRCVDLAVALPVVLFVLPLATLLVWAMQRWQSPGPIFFRQLRSGMQSRPFAMLKFRTMHAENDDETRQVRRGDPRVFPAGYWLRRLSIDELPQFYNVLRGDMSVVGPRPHLPTHDELFARALKNYRVRAVVKPGITGLAQVRGFRGGTESESDVVNRVKADIQYLETWTIEMDCRIILQTIGQMLAPPKTAY